MVSDTGFVAEESAAAVAPALTSEHGRNLFLVGFLVLFLELACIRWFSAYAVFLQFFTNVILLAAFLGMSCGCLASKSKRDWLALFPIITLGTVIAAIMTLEVYKRWHGLSVDVGGNSGSPQEVFFGTEYRNPDVAQFVIPIDVIVAAFFVMVSLMFVGLGQVLGRAFDAIPNRVMGYTLNIGGSLVGIAAFTGLSFVQAPPVVWFGVGCAGVAYLLYRAGTLNIAKAAALIAVVGLVWRILAIAAPMNQYAKHDVRWSPYYAVDHDVPRGEILVNTVGHQNMVPYDTAGSTYSLIHLLRKHSGGEPFKDVMVIGAGSGNDLTHALKAGVGQIDAVEIDPVIQSIGIQSHPNKPYQDPRVIRHLDDGRHFLRTTDKQYDLVVYALVDSLIMHSGYANLRLESYLFTEQAFADIKRVLKPGGVFVTYNYFRQGWIVARVAAMAEKAFGCAPTVLSLPYREVVEPSSSAEGGFTMIIAGCNPEIAAALKEKGPFWLNTVPPKNVDVNGFSIQPETLPAEERAQWEKIAPSKVVTGATPPDAITDDWPFLYLSGKLIPDLSIRSMIVLGLLGIAMIACFMPRKRAGGINGTMFFLGAAFMLLEAKAVVQLALLFGSTWLVNSGVFFTVLVLILLANLYVLKVPNVGRLPHYVALFALLALNLVVPLDTFLDGGVLWRYVVPCALALGPMFFAGVIFALSFREAKDADMAFGSNIAGSVVGGLSESFSMLLGFRYLLAVAVLFYAASALVGGLKRRGT